MINLNIKYIMKFAHLTLFAFFISISIQAQSLSEGMHALEIGRMQSAKKIFAGLIQKEPQNASAYYYAGTAYLGSNKPDSAAIFFEKGKNVNPNEPLNYIGLGTIALNKNDQAKAQTNFDKAISLGPKNSAVFIALGSTHIYSENPDYKKAIQMLTKAKDLDKNNPLIYVLMGDAYVELVDGGNALSSYEKSIEIDKKYILGSLKLGETWVRIKNNDEALAAFQKVLKLDSTYAPVYRDLGELYYQMHQLPKAKEAYKKYIDLSEHNIDAKIRYAKFLYLSNEFQNAVDEIKSIMKTDTSNTILYRLLGYSSYETGDFTGGVTAMQKFFTKVNPKKILPSDYENYGKLLSKTGNDSLAIANVKKATQLDSSKTELYTTLSELYVKAKQYKEAADALGLKIKNSKKTSIQDYHKYGIALYKANEFEKADSAFMKVIELNPTFQGGYLWRANCNAQLDRDLKKGLAKPYYEKFIEMASSDPGKYKIDLIVAYKYLGYYYFLRKNNQEAKHFYLKVKELDPNDKQMNDVLKELK
jgi:tetratricopeptide (TPR) repeat protein